MRIEIPTNNPAPILDREGPKPESNEAKGEPAFFAVIGQMSAEGDHSKQTVERIPSLTADRKEVQKKETEKKGHECERPSPGTMPSAFLASERQQAVAAPDSSRPACESCNTSSADGPLDSKGASPEGSAAPPESASAEGPASPVADATSPGKPAPEATGSTSPGMPSPEVPDQEFDASTDRASQGDVARAEQASVEAAGAPFWTLSQPVTDTALQAGLTAPVASTPAASLETGSSQAPAEGASTLTAPGPSVNVTSVPQHTLDVVSGARIKAGVLEVDVTVPSIGANDKRLWESFDNRQDAKGGWAWGRHGDHEQAEVSPQALQDSTEVRAATPAAGLGSALITSSSRTGTPIEVPDRSSSEAQPAAVESGKSESGGHHPLPDDLASLAVADMQEVQSMISHSQPARTSDTGTPISGMQRQVQDMESMTSTSSAVGTQSLPNAADSDLKGLSALLAPKHTAPAQEPDFLSVLARRIDMQLRDGENVIRIQLKPSSLGRMEIMAETSGTRVVATITTESSGVKNYLEHNLHQLQQSFLDQGLKVDRINVTVQEGLQPQYSSSGSQDSRSGGGQRGESKSPVWHGSQFEWSSEELTVDTQTLMALGPHSTFHTVA